MGLPMYFSSENGGVVCLEGDVDTRLSDSEILELLSGGVILASDTALNLINRGFGKYIGVNVQKWCGKIPVREKILINGAFTKIQEGTMELVPLNDEVKVNSYACNTCDYENYEELFPACTTYKNSLGGTVTVFCGTPVAEFHLDKAFSFLTYSRKLQLIDIIKQCGELPVYYPNDEEVYLKCADMENGNLFCAVFNIGLDKIDVLELVLDFEPKGFEKLLPDGSTTLVDFKCENGKYILDSSCDTQDPVILFIKR